MPMTNRDSRGGGEFLAMPKIENISLLATAVVKQAFRDLLNPCAKMRAEAIEFFSLPQPWLIFLDLHNDFVCKRLAPIFEKLEEFSGCFSLSAHNKCAGCQTSYTSKEAGRQRLKLKELRAYKKSLSEFNPREGT